MFIVDPHLLPYKALHDRNVGIHLSSAAVCRATGIITDELEVSS